MSALRAPSYEATRATLSRLSATEATLLFPVWKLITTVLSYLSGMAGGIFSPCLSIGAGIGTSVAKLAHFTNFKAENKPFKRIVFTHSPILLS